MIDINQLLAQMRANQAQSQMTFPPVVGRAPPQQPLPFGPGTMMSNHMMPPGLLGQAGPYQQQAQQLAGLLGGQQQFPVMGSPYSPGRFVPGFQPGIDQPSPGGGGKYPNLRSRV